MTTLKTFCQTFLKGSIAKSLLLAGALFSFTACEEGSLDDYYNTPSCSMTEEQKQTQKTLDVAAIEKYFEDNEIDLTDVQTTASGIYYFNLSEGAGELLKNGDKVQIHYVGKFMNGSTFENSTTFDSSYDSATPITVVVGSEKTTDGIQPVIAGWNEALQLMKVGEETRFYIPSYLAYGKCARAGIPANSNLVFDIKVLKKL